MKNPRAVLPALMLVASVAGAQGTDNTGANDDKPMVDETVFSPHVRFTGEVVEALPSGQAIRKYAVVRGRAFTWRRKLAARVATPEAERHIRATPLDVDNLSVEELAEKLRGLALFRGHEFIESQPAYDLARAAKLHRQLEREGASAEALRRELPAVTPSQGSARRSRYLGKGEQPERLPTPAASAAPAAPVLEVVHGTDDRAVFDNTIYPHRTQIVFDNTGSTSTIDGAEGSGTLIGPSTAMSVAHVFWDEANGTWEADHKWAPGFDSADADSSPWGDWFRCYWVTIPVAYTQNVNDNQFDFAVLDFNVGCNSVDNGVNSDRPGSTVGWLGFYTASTDEIESHLGYVRGYPGLGTCGSPGRSCGVRVWGDTSGSSENDASSEEILHQADSSGGQSGSGFYHYADPNCGGCGYGPYLVGMHRAGSSDANHARRFDSTVYSFMRAYSSDY